MPSPTLDLILRPAHGWQHVSAERETCTRPLLDVGRVAGISVGSAFLGCLISGTDVGDATVILLASTAGYLGAGIAAVRLLPLLDFPGATPVALARYGGAVALPVLATGVAYLTPWKIIWWLTVIAGCTLTAYSAVTGARSIPGGLGQNHLTAAALAAALASAPVLALAAFRSAA